MRLAWLAGVFVGLASTAEAGTFHVFPGGPYPTIQAAIDSAATGDTLLIATGVWEENPLVVRKDLLLRGAPGAPTVIDGGPGSTRPNSGAVLRVVGSYVRLENLVLRNGRAPVGAGVMMFSGTLEMRHCRVADNLYGVLAVSGQFIVLDIQDSEFVANGIGVFGTVWTSVTRSRIHSGRLALVAGGQVDLTDVEILDNGTPGQTDAGALHLGGAQGRLERVTVARNWSDAASGGIWLSGGNFQLVDVTVEDNVSENGPAGIGVDLSATTTLDRCTVRRNRSRGAIDIGVAGLLVIRSNVTAVDCDIRDNHSEDPGGGVAVQRNSNLRLERSRLIGNRSDREGGGLAVFNSTATLERVVLAGNQAGLGGGIMTNRSGRIAADRVTVVANQALRGGGLLLLGNDSELRRSIVAFHAGTDGIYCEANLRLECVDVFGNGDDAICGTDGGGNLSVDPRFCNLDAALAEYDLQLRQDSPIADAGGCGAFGAEPVGCSGQTHAEPTTWSRFKRRYR